MDSLILHESKKCVNEIWLVGLFESCVRIAIKVGVSSGSVHSICVKAKFAWEWAWFATHHGVGTDKIVMQERKRECLVLI